MDEVPVIVTVVKWAGRVLGYACFVTALPTVAWIFLCELLAAAAQTPNLALQALVALPRVAALLAAAPVWLGQPALLGYLLATRVSTTAGVLSALGFFFAALFGLIYSQFDHYLKACNFRAFLFGRRHGGYWWNLGQGCLDLLALAAVILSLATVVRAPALVVVLVAAATVGRDETDTDGFHTRCLPQETAGGRSIREELFYNALMVVVDLFTLPFAVVLFLLVPWRLVGLRKRVAKRTHWNSLALVDNMKVRKKIIGAALNGLLDVPCFATLVFFVLTPWRFRELKFKNKNVNERRVEVLEQFGQCLLDLFFILLGTIVVCFLWRAFPLIRSLTIKHERMSAWNRRKMAGQQLIYMLFDVLVFAFSVPLLLTGYRIPRLIHKWRKADSSWGYSYSTERWRYSDAKAQKRMALQAIYVLRDLPFFVMGFFVLVSWRTWFLVRNLWRIDHPLPGAAPVRRRGHERRMAVARQFGQLLIDLPIFLLAGIATVCFLWRAVIMWYEIKHATTTKQRRLAVIRNFLNFFVDLPFAFCALVVTALLWRAFFMWREVYRLWHPLPGHPHAANQWETRLVLARHFGLLFVDLIDVPFAILSLGIVVTGWRLPAFWRALRACRTRNQRRLVALKELGLWLLDIPTFFACFIVLVTFYRAKTMLKALHRHLSAFFHEAHPPPAAPPPLHPAGEEPAVAAVEHDEDNPAPASAAQEAPTRGTWHIIVWANFGLVMLDVPFPILLLLTLWRLPWCAKRLLRECESARERRLTILRYLLLMVRDIPCIILFIPMLLTVWRLPSVVQMFKKLERGDNEHKLFLAIFLQWIIDLPFAFMLLWTLVCVWRAPFVLRTIVSKCDNAKKRRMRIAQYFGHTFLDILLALLCAFNTIVFPWRLLSFRRRYFAFLNEIPVENHFWRNSTAFYLAVLRTTGQGAIDMPFVFVGLLQVVFVWRYPFFLRHVLYTKWNERAVYRRKYTMIYFGIGCLDVLAALGQVILCLCFWRIPTFRRKMGKELARTRAEQQEYERRVEDAVTRDLPLPAPRSNFVLSFAWYRALVRALRDLLVDLPFLAMGTFVCLCFWRIPGYMRQIVVIVRRPVEQHIQSGDLSEHRSRKHDKYRRWVTLWYFLHSLADVVCALLLLPALALALWRIPTFIVASIDTIKDDEFRNSHWKHSIAWHIGAVYTFGMMIRDIWMIFMTAMIVVGAVHVPCLIRHIIDFEKLKIRRDRKMRHRQATVAAAAAAAVDEAHAPDPPAALPKQPMPAISERALGIWATRTKRRMKSEEPAPMPLSPTIFFDAVDFEFKCTLGFIPEIFLSPLKLLGLLVIPLYLYTNWRLGVKTTLRPTARAPEAAAAGPAVPEDRRTPWEKLCARKSLSFVVFPSFFVQELASGTLTLIGIQDILFLACCSFPLLLWNELGFIPLILNHVVMLVITWFDPIFMICRRSSGYTYGSPPNAAWVAFEILYSLWLAIMVPVFFAIQAFYLVLPIVIFGALQFPQTPGFVEFWKAFFSRVFWAEYVPAIDPWMWAVSAFWWLALLPGWHLTFKQVKRFYELFEPLNVYILLAKRVVAGTIWKGYKAILSNASTWSFIHRRSCCFIGQWTVALAFLVWSCWPFLAVGIAAKYWTGWYWLFIFSVPASVFLIWKGYGAVKKHWKAPPAICRKGLENVVVLCEFPTGGGIKLTVSASKDPELVVRQAILKLEGDDLWRKLAQVVPGGKKIITTFKILFYPIKLCPNFLNPADFVQGSSSLNSIIQFGTSGKLVIKKKLVLRYAQRIVDAGDPEFRLLVEFGDNTFRWIKHGELLSVTTRLSTVLSCVERNLPLPIPRADGTLPELPAVDPASAATSASASAVSAAAAVAPEPATVPFEIPPPVASESSSSSAASVDHQPAERTASDLRARHYDLVSLAEQVGVPLHTALGALQWMEENGRDITQDAFLDTVWQPNEEVLAAATTFQQ